MDFGTKSEIVSRSVSQRITAALFVSQSLFSAAMIAAFTLMPIIAAELAASDSAAGIPNTLTLLGRAAAAYPIGWLMDRVGRRWALSTGFGLGVAGSVLAVFSVIGRSFWGFCAGAALTGMGRASSDLSRYVAAEVQPSARRAKTIGLIVFAGTIGAVGGPALVAPSGDWAARLDLLAETGPFVAAAVLYGLALLIAMLFLRPDPREIGAAIAQREADDAKTVVVPARPLRQIFSHPLVLLAVASMIIGQLVMVLIMVITPLHMNHHNHGTESISLVIMAHTLGMFGLSGVTGWLIDQYGRILLIAVGAAVLIGASTMASQAVTVPALAVALFLLGLGWNFCFIAGSSLFSDSLAANERAQAQGASEVLVALAAGTGSLGTGAVFDFGGMTAISAVGLAFSLALVAFVAWYRLLISRKRPGESSPGNVG